MKKKDDLHGDRRKGTARSGAPMQKDMVRGSPEGDAPVLNHEQQRIGTWLKQVRFQKAVFGGVNEADVWKKIAELNTMYEAALSAERARYDALLKEHIETAARQMANQMYHQAVRTAAQEQADHGKYD